MRRKGRQRRHRLFPGRHRLGARMWQQRRLHFEPLEFRCLLSGSPVILSEILAGNKTGIPDSAGSQTDWLEIQNTSSTQR